MINLFIISLRGEGINYRSNVSPHLKLPATLKTAILAIHHPVFFVDSFKLTPWGMIIEIDTVLVVY